MKTLVQSISGSDDADIVFKYFIPEQILYPHPVLIAHGFKGFMDWGHFPDVAQKIANQGFLVVTINFSHNGTSLEHPMDFVRLDLFAKNTYSKELYDLGQVLDELENSSILNQYSVDGSKVSLIGHSRGGGMSIIKAAEDKRVVKLITWAAIGSVGSFFGKNDELIEEWKLKGEIITFNARTGQEMPLKYALYEDTLLNSERLDIMKAATTIQKPWLIIHGEIDPTVPVSVAEELHRKSPSSELYIMPSAHHNFGGKHPLDDQADFEQIELLAQKTIEFLKESKG